MNNFITNSGASDLKKRLVELMAKSEELKFLVGFFYFSGIRELYEGLKANPNTIIKILVGLDIDYHNFKLIEFSEDEKLSGEEKINKFLESVRKSLTNENFDKKEFYEQIGFFIELIQKNKLIIKKTSKPNHAKLYLFKLQEVGRKELFITGSSNLTRAGLSTQNEFNVEISDYGFKDAEEYFDELWNLAEKITEFEDVKKRLIEIIESETIIKEITPFEAFVLALKTYLDSFPKAEVSESLSKLMKKNGYIPYQYQLDAVGQARSVIENENGVIIADVVGLGKTIIACAIAKEMNKRGIVICPPGLVGDINSGWKKYLEEFELDNWEVWSRGDLENTFDFTQKAKNIEVIIIDEAHWFRNQDTKNHALMKDICRGKKVILLTATPFNNHPSDILSLLILFSLTKKSNLTLDGNLANQFNRFGNEFDKLGYIKKYHNSEDEDKRKIALKHYKTLFEEGEIDLKKVDQKARLLSIKMRSVIEPVTIRRNRMDLQNHPIYKKEVKNLSKIANPIEWLYGLTNVQLEFYTEIIEKYFGDSKNGGKFKGAIYRPFEYKKGLNKKTEEKLNMEDNRQYTQQRNLFDFMRRMIVKRFESSFGAFEQSIKNFQRITEIVLEFIKKTGKGDLFDGEYILDRDLLEKICDLDADKIEKYLLDYEEKIIKGEYPKNHERYKIKDFADKEKFIADIKSDLEMYCEILQNLSSLDLLKNDPKTACLIENIKKKFAEKSANGEPKRKIIIFSEYVDTVKYLEAGLKKDFKDRLSTITGDLSKAKISEINKNFDASYKEQKNSFDILLSSDKISEGFNLNRAGMVINYDIPWNPVRVIQRVGRINRISKKVFEELFIVNFFPTEKGAALVKSREIAANKMFLIHTALGEDSKIFHIDEKPTPAGLFKNIQQNPDKRDEESFYNQMLRKYAEIEKNNPELIEKIKNYPPMIKSAKAYGENELLVFFKKSRLFINGAKANEKKIEPYQISFEEVFEKIVCEPKEKSLEWNTDQFWKAYQTIKDFKEYRAGTVKEQSLEQKALNNLVSIINNQEKDLTAHKNFLRTLREDIINYGTLGDYTLRRIFNLKTEKEKLKETIMEIEALKKELGENYLIKEKARLKDIKKEIIIAIENKK
ncbi:MAG: helicase-related protein [Patescibacteria group bacterium]